MIRVSKTGRGYTAKKEGGASFDERCAAEPPKSADLFRLFAMVRLDCANEAAGRADGAVAEETAKANPTRASPDGRPGSLRRRSTRLRYLDPAESRCDGASIRA